MVKKTEKVEEVEVSEFNVEDPQILRPKELPLVVTPADGNWKNAEQEKYAAVLNGYAYKNPEKWASKKAVLLKQLTEIGVNPSALTKYIGVQGNLSYTNKLIQTAEDNS